MVGYIFWGLAFVLLVTFFGLAYVYKKMGIFGTGAVIANLYFLAISEMIVKVFNQKLGVGVIGLDEMLKFFVNPYKGDYRFFLLNFQYNKGYFIFLWLLTLGGLAALYYFINKKGQESSVSSDSAQVL